ncbi:MAG: biotin transporter BioY [Clostridiales bacterium]|nr:biotin transporter BioY [Clostridiales bacterium]
MTTKTYSKTTCLILCGIFAAITAICSFVTIPLGFTPVPVNLGTLAVFLAGGLLGPKYGPLSQLVYILVGAVGVPVFAGFRGGFGVLMGPTGGYIIGYIAATLIIGLLLDRLWDERRNLMLCALSMALGLIVCYALGTAWFIISTGSNVEAALVSCILPFIPGDIIKIIVATILTRRLKPTLSF